MRYPQLDAELEKLSQDEWARLDVGQFIVDNLDTFLRVFLSHTSQLPQGHSADDVKHSIAAELMTVLPAQHTRSLNCPADKRGKNLMAYSASIIKTRIVHTLFSSVFTYCSSEDSVPQDQLGICHIDGGINDTRYDLSSVQFLTDKPYSIEEDDQFKELHYMLEGIRHHLTNRQYQALRLKITNHSTQSISEIMGICQYSVRARIREARGRMESLLACAS